MNSGLILPGKFEKNVVQKAERYLKGKKCRKMKSGHDYYGYGIERGSPVESRHLQSLILYTDFTRFCTEFSRKFRVETEEEELQSVNEKNGDYFHTAKALREFIDLFGNNGKRNWNEKLKPGKESGPFWCGINCILNVPEFAISFNGPTSTTKTKEIALRFAGECGMMMVMNNKEGVSQYENFMNCKWISNYPEEDERLFMGSNAYLTVDSLVVIANAKNYRVSMGAYSKMDRVLKGYCVEFTDSEVDFLRGAMESVRGRGTEWKTVQLLDQFAVDNFYLMALKKTEIKLILHHNNRIKPKSFIDLLFHSVSKQKGGDVPDDTTNVMRGDFISLFTNLSTVTIRAWGGFPFSVCRLMDELSAVDLPRSLSTIKIIDDKNENGFIRKAMDSEDLRKRLDAMNMTMEFEYQFGRFDILTLRFNF